MIFTISFACILLFHVTAGISPQVEFLAYVDNTPNTWITMETSILAPSGRAYHTITEIAGYDRVIMYGGLGAEFFSKSSTVTSVICSDTTGHGLGGVMGL